MKTKIKEKFWLPLLVAVCVVIGLVLGTLITRNNNQAYDKHLSGLNKISALLSLIDSKYVDTVDINHITENMIPSILAELDPHSVYIPAADRERTDEQLEGSFSGIGVEFRMLEDTIFITSVIKGGPSDKAGILAGDQIITIDDSVYAGKKRSSDDIMKRLRGKKGTQVSVGIQRYGTPVLLKKTLVRGDIPLYSVNASYKIGDEIGYIRINDFGRNAHAEFLNAVARLVNKGCTRFIIDLRGNTGGLMDPALNIANEFLPKNSLILYTEGKAYKREDVRSNGSGSCQKFPLVILTDQWSASSSEILTGALQDNDRAWVVGRRTFGKGLVQTEIPFRDGSAVRLTIARFYIPSGRCIQKPYTNGADKSYQMDILNRYLNGELGSKDSIRLIDTLKFKTKGGRIVYGGGGILPDYFVPLDTTGYTVWYSQVVNNGLISAFAYRYAVHQAAILKTFDTPGKIAAYLDEQDLINPFLKFAEAQKIRGRRDFISISYPLVLRDIKANVSRMVLGEDSFWQLYQANDPVLDKGVEVVMKATNVVAGSGPLE